jgi:hypothetical protein
MVKRFVLIAVILGCLNVGSSQDIPVVFPPPIPQTGGWYNIANDDKTLIGLVVRGVNFINNELKLSSALQ